MPNHHPMTGEITSNGTPLSTGDGPFTRGYVDNALQPDGTLYNMPTGSTSEGFYPAPNRVVCLSCHANGHSGRSGTGARLLRKGWAGAASGTPAPQTAVVGVAVTGVDRQYDKDQSGTNRLITNWQPLCDACHKVDD